MRAELNGRRHAYCERVGTGSGRDSRGKKHLARGRPVALSDDARCAIARRAPMKNVHSPIDNALSSRHSLLAVPLLLARQRKSNAIFSYVQTQIGGTTMAAKKKTAAKKPVKKAVKKPAKKAAAKFLSV